jgi:hypothetical protein
MAHRHDIHSWRAWYAGGAKYDSSQHSWRELPEVGCVVVVVYLQTEWAPGKKYRRMHDCTDLVCVRQDIGFDHQVALSNWTGRVEFALRDAALLDYPETAWEDWKLGVAVETNAFLKMCADAVAAEDSPCPASSTK